jgi:hypothetical protein
MTSNVQANQILIVSASERRFELQKSIHESLSVAVSVVATFQEALSAVAISRYQAVVLDEGLADLNPTAADDFLAHCSDELPIFVKLAITGVPRCVQQVQLAIRRFDRERQIIVNAARCSIHSQLRDALTAVLISSQLALKTSGLSQEAMKHLTAVLKAAESLQKSIESKLE